MVFYPYEITCVRQNDGCDLQDGVPVVEGRTLRGCYELYRTKGAVERLNVIFTSL
jgi:hypothetical protein